MAIKRKRCTALATHFDCINPPPRIPFNAVHPRQERTMNPVTSNVTIDGCAAAMLGCH